MSYGYNLHRNDFLKTCVFCNHAALVLLGRRGAHRNVNDISERAGSHYFCSTRQHIVRLSCAQ